MANLNVSSKWFFCEGCECEKGSSHYQKCKRLAEEKKEESVVLEEWCETPCQYCGNHWYKPGHHLCISCGY